jgi:L-ribulose-5-phosphate 4-epimerase
MLETLKQVVYECNMELPKNGLVVMTSGNVSGRDPESGLVVIKPSGYSYAKMTAQDMVVVDLDGQVVEGHLTPSIDTSTHLHIYRFRPDVGGVVHTHSTFASVFAVLGKPIPSCTTTSTMLGGEIPLGDFIPIGGKAIGEEILQKIGDKLGIVMQNHGVFTIGRDAYHATKLAVELEEIAKITYFAMLAGNPIVLTPEQVELTRHMYENDYGQK